MSPQVNPFVVYGHIPEEYFCDRREEASKMLSLLTNQQNVVLASARRMGKSSLVDYVFSKPEIQHNYITISIDILDTSNLSEFVFAFGNTVFERIARRSERLMKLFPMVMKSLKASFGYDPVQGTPTFDIKLGDMVRPEYTLREIFEYLDQADRRCLVVIDEFQQITNYPEKNVEATLRTFMQKTSNVNFVFAGSQRRIMSEIFGSEKRPFYNSARQIDLDPIPLGIYTDFVTTHFHAAGKDIQPEAVHTVYEQLKGVTLYLQQAMNDAYTLTPTGTLCTIDTVKQLIDKLIAENDKRFRELLQFVTEQQKAVLYAIHADAPVKSITSGAFTKKHRLKSPSATQSAMKSLLRADLVTRSEGYYYVSDPLLSLWLRHR